MSGGMTDFYTRERANEGVELPLYLPSGEKSTHWLRIRGIDSDHFRAATEASKRDIMRIAQLETQDERDKEINAGRLRLVASLVAAWSFEEECTPEAVENFLREAPQITDKIDQIAAKRALFFASASKSSVNSPVPNSD